MLKMTEDSSTEKEEKEEDDKEDRNIYSFSYNYYDYCRDLCNAFLVMLSILVLFVLPGFVLFFVLYFIEYYYQDQDDNNNSF